MRIILNGLAGKKVEISTQYASRSMSLETDEAEKKLRQNVRQSLFSEYLL